MGIDVESRLEHIADVKRYGVSIGIEFRGILSKYDKRCDSKLYSLTVTRPNELVAFAEEETLGRSKRRLLSKKISYAAKGFDTILHPSLGWEDCQITTYMLMKPYVWLTGTVLHEGWHRTTGIADLEVDEGLAGVIEDIGTIEYSKLHRKMDLETANAIHEETMIFSNYIVKYHDLLAEAYKNSGWEKAKDSIIVEATKEGNVLRKMMRTHVKKNLIKQGRLNNAYFFFYSPYSRYYRETAMLVHKLGLEESISFLKRFASPTVCIKEMRKIIDA